MKFEAPFPNKRIVREGPSGRYLAFKAFSSYISNKSSLY